MSLWRNISNLGIKSESDPSTIRRSQMTNRMIFIAICMGFSYIPMYISIGSFEPLFQNILLTSLTATLFFFSARGKHEVAAFLLCLLILTHILTVSILIQGGTGRYYLIEVSVLGFTMIRSVRTSFILFMLCLIAFFIAESAHYFIEPLFVRNNDENVIVYAFNIVLIFFGGLYLIYHLKRTNDYFAKNLIEQKDRIELQHAQLEETHREIKDSIVYAKRIQSAILPPVEKLSVFFKDHFVLYIPKDIVAGDFYWIQESQDYHRLATAESESGSYKIFIAVADCTGHGVPGAMMSVMCSNSLNRAVKEFQIHAPGQILDKTRDLLVDMLHESGQTIHDGMDAALVSVEFDKHHKLKAIEFAGAQNPLWLVRHGELIEMPGDKQPVGHFEKAVSYQTHRIDVQKGDMIYLFTDGLADQFGSENHTEKDAKIKKFGIKKLRRLLSMISELSPHEQKKAIQNSFQAWKGNIDQLDDVCILGFRV
ncbi:MAG: serine/threonine-protein phosphatase [Crocinitomicaceae bacterium]|nr:serine/threonine-protein phosphatase [Crocinitomicaceae bacterium]MBK8924835.1 serine/threonine-protein phosphatase [Crocinitomicaceae bacterium]